MLGGRNIDGEVLGTVEAGASFLLSACEMDERSSSASDLQHAARSMGACQGLQIALRMAVLP